MSLELKNIVQLIKLHIRKNYIFIWTILLTSLILSFFELIKVFTWNPAEYPNYVIELGEFSGLYVSFFLPAFLIFESRKILMDTQISMYPGTSLTRFLSRVTTDCLMLFIIPLCICLETILQHALLSLFNLAGITHVILPFSWEYLLYHLVSQTLLSITIYSFFLVFWIIITKLPVLASQILIIVVAALGVMGFLNFDLPATFLEKLISCFVDSLPASGKALPNAVFVRTTLLTSLALLFLCTLLAKRHKVWQESSAKNKLAAVLGGISFLYISIVFLFAPADVSTDYAYSRSGHALTTVKKEFSFDADYMQLQTALFQENVITTPRIKNPAASTEDTAEPYISGSNLGIYLEYDSPSNSWTLLSKDELNNLGIKTQFPTSDDTINLQILGPETYIKGSGFIFQNLVDEIDVTLKENNLQVSLPTSPIILPNSFGVKYYENCSGWNEVVSWTYSCEGNPFYAMAFVVQGTDETIDAIKKNQ